MVVKLGWGGPTLEQKNVTSGQEEPPGWHKALQSKGMPVLVEHERKKRVEQV
jgi:hypothetical protein